MKKLRLSLGILLVLVLTGCASGNESENTSESSRKLYMDYDVETSINSDDTLVEPIVISDEE